MIDGNNTFTAVAQDGVGRSDTVASTVYLPASITFTYDSNGNLTGDGKRAFDYDDENELIRVTVANSWKTEFVYDGKQRRRVRKEFLWVSSAWVQTNEVRYVYDGNLVIQERDSNNLPLISYTRGRDMGGDLEAAGGIGGLLARTDNGSQVTSYFVADGSGNVTALVSGQQFLVGKYLYDSFGNIISASGPLVDVNLYRFSSKEAHPSSGLIYFGRRFYDPNLQRWTNRDPLGVQGGVNLYAYVNNSPLGAIDAGGLGGVEIDSRMVTKDEVYHDQAVALPGWSGGDPRVVLFRGLGATWIDESTLSFPQITFDFNPLTKRCRVTFLSILNVDIITRSLSADRYGFPLALRDFRVTTPTGPSTIWYRGTVLDAAGATDVYNHELKHARIYKEYFEKTWGVLEKEYAAFNVGKMKTRSAGQCADEVNKWAGVAWHRFLLRDATEDPKATRAQYQLDNVVIRFQDTGGGFMQYLGERAIQAGEIFPFYDPSTGRFEDLGGR